MKPQIIAFEVCALKYEIMLEIKSTLSKYYAVYYDDQTTTENCENELRRKCSYLSYNCEKTKKKTNNRCCYVCSRWLMSDGVPHFRRKSLKKRRKKKPANKQLCISNLFEIRMEKSVVLFVCCKAHHTIRRFKFRGVCGLLIFEHFCFVFFFKLYAAFHICFSVSVWMMGPERQYANLRVIKSYAEVKSNILLTGIMFVICL